MELKDLNKMNNGKNEVKLGSDIALSWLEVILIVLMALSSLGISLRIEEQVVANVMDYAPREEDFSTEISIIESNLSAIENELVLMNREIIQKRQALSQLRSQKHSMEKSHPEFREIPPLPGAVQDLPQEAVKDYFDTLDGIHFSQQLRDKLLGERSDLIDMIIDLSTYTYVAETPTAPIIIEETNLSLAESELASTKEIIAEQKLYLTKQQAKMDILKNLYPGISNSIILTDALQSSSGIAKSYLDNQVEISTTLRFIQLLESDIVELSERVSEASHIASQTEIAVTKKDQETKTDLIRAEKRLSQIEKELSFHKMELLEKRVSLKRTHRIYPSLLGIQNSLKEFPFRSQDSIRSYLYVKVNLTRGRTELDQLIGARDSLVSEFNDYSESLADCRRKTSQEITQAQRRFQFHKRLLVSGFGILGSVIFLTLMYLILRLVLIPKMNLYKSVDLSILFGITVLLVIILIAYQSFGLVGASLLGLAIIVLMIRFLSSRVCSDSKRNSGESG
jgi:hypothetical protein